MAGNIKGITIELGADTTSFNKALKGLNADSSKLQSELKQVNAALKLDPKNTELLAQKQKLMTEAVEQTTVKLNALKSAKEKADKDMANGTDVNQEQYRKLQREIVFTEQKLKGLENQLEPTTDDMKDMAKQTEKAGDTATTSGTKFEKFGGVIKGIGVSMGTVAVAAGVAAVKLGKEVIEAYADYEQLVGGIDTLFKDSSGKMQEYAANAYKTSGLSANQYMETVTGFSASLISSLGGDTGKAVEYANMAVTDMSDNANKMGTDMASIQNAYQGFAKQNYTMLDNLKLGYGGTKEEMQRLLKDAQAISGIKYDISSYADVVSAINVIQTQMGITGTTAKEAEKTITGSITSLKTSFGNLLVGFGDANADVQGLTNNVIDAFSNVVTNITPIIENIVKALPTAISAIIPAIVNLLPVIWQTVNDLFKELLSVILGLLPELIPVAIDATLTIVNTLIENLPLLIDAAIQVIIALVTGITQALPTLIPAIIDVTLTIVDTLLDNIPLLIDCALQLIIGLAIGLVQAIPALVEKLPTIIIKIVNTFINMAPQILEAGVKLCVELGKGLIKAIPQLVKNIPTIVTNMVDELKKGMTKFTNIGKNIVEGIWNGIKNTGNWLWNQVSGFFGGIIDKIKNLLGIHSPSRVFAGIGGFMAEGLGIGFTDEMKTISKDINNAIPTSFNIKRDVSVYGSNVPYAQQHQGVMQQQVTPQNIVTHINIDGREFAVATTPYISEELAFG